MLPTAFCRVPTAPPIRGIRVIRGETLLRSPLCVLCTTHVRNRPFPEESRKPNPKITSTDSHRLSQIEEPSEERLNGVKKATARSRPYASWVSPRSPSFFLSVSICENLWIPCFSILGFSPSWVAASPRWGLRVRSSSVFRPPRRRMRLSRSSERAARSSRSTGCIRCCGHRVGPVSCLVRGAGRCGQEDADFTRRLS